MLSSVCAPKTPRRVTVETTLLIHREYTIRSDHHQIGQSPTIPRSSRRKRRHGEARLPATHAGRPGAVHDPTTSAARGDRSFRAFPRLAWGSPSGAERKAAPRAGRGEDSRAGGRDRRRDRDRCAAPPRSLGRGSPGQGATGLDSQSGRSLSRTPRADEGGGRRAKGEGQRAGARVWAGPRR